MYSVGLLPFFEHYGDCHRIPGPQAANVPHPPGQTRSPRRPYHQCSRQYWDYIGLEESIRPIDNTRADFSGPGNMDRVPAEGATPVPPRDRHEAPPPTPYIQPTPKKGVRGFGLIVGSNSFDRAAFTDTLGPIDTIFIVYINQWNQGYDMDVHLPSRFVCIFNKY